MDKLKVLVFDIERSPMLAHVWGLRDQNISLKHVIRESHILSFAAKWLGAPASEVIYHDQRKAKDITKDKPLLKKIWKLLDEADIVVTHYGSGFDSPVLNAGFIANNMKPPSDYRHLDTFKIATRVAKFQSNKLEYLTDKLCTKYKKLSHEKYPGMELWNACLQGDQKAWKEMEKYNIHDVLSTEELFTKLQPWIPDSMPDVYWISDDARECRKCGRTGTMVSKGFRWTKRYKYRRYQCTKCGSCARGGRIK